MKNKVKGFGWIFTHYQQNPSVEEMAQVFGMDALLFQRKFKQWSGVSPKKFVYDLRMQEVERLLVETNVTIKEIAFSLSFSDSSALSSAFRKKHGVTPSVFRRRSWGGFRS